MQIILLGSINASTQFESVYGPLLRKKLDKQNEIVQKIIEKSEIVKNRITQTKMEIEELEVANKAENIKIEKYISQYNENILQLKNEIKSQKKKFYFKLASPERSYLFCIDRALGDKDHALIRNCNHKKANITDSNVMKILNDIEQKLSISIEEAKNKKKEINEEFQKALNSKTRLLIDSEKRVINPQIIEEEITLMRDFSAEYQEFNGFMKKYSTFLNCDEHTPTINMEEKILVEGESNARSGYLYQVPRDDQLTFQTGTCYSHVAKDMLTAILRGKDSPSFFDLANIYSKSLGRFDNIDGGDLCKILDLVKEKGYCPNQFSAFEYFKSQSIKNSSLRYSSSNISLLWNKLKELSTAITSSNYAFYKDEVIDRLNDLYSHLNHNKIKVDINNGAAAKFIPEWKWQEFYSKIEFNDNSMDFEKFKVLIKSWIVSENINVMLKFNDKITSNCTSNINERICLSFKEEVLGYLAKSLKNYLEKFTNNVDEKIVIIHPSITNEVLSFISHPAYLEQIKKFNSILPQLKISNQTELDDRDLVKIKIFLLSLEILSVSIEIFEQTGIEFHPVLMFMRPGISPTQQLLSAIAPGCENENIRRQLPNNLVCETEREPIRLINSPVINPYIKELFRFKILKNILAVDSTPVGNIVTNSGGLHINSIVGFRRNTIGAGCQYLVRDSNGANSVWINEEEVIQNNNGFKIIKPRFHRY